MNSRQHLPKEANLRLDCSRTMHALSFVDLCETAAAWCEIALAFDAILREPLRKQGIDRLILTFQNVVTAALCHGLDGRETAATSSLSRLLLVRSDARFWLRHTLTLLRGFQNGITLGASRRLLDDDVWSGTLHRKAN